MRKLWLFAAFVALGCGARTGLQLLPSQAAGGSGATGGSAGTAGSGGTGGSAGAPACVTWSVVPGDPVALTEPIGDSLLTALVRDGNHVTVGSTNDAQGCRFVELGADGAASVAPHRIAKSWCYWPVATQSGFIAFNSPDFTFAPLTLLTMNKHGHVTKTTPDLITSGAPQTYPAGLARFNDATVLVAWSDSGGGFTAQHLDQNGNKLAPESGLRRPAHRAAADARHDERRHRPCRRDPRRGQCRMRRHAMLVSMRQRRAR